MARATVEGIVSESHKLPVMGFILYVFRGGRGGWWKRRFVAVVDPEIHGSRGTCENFL